MDFVILVFIFRREAEAQAECYPTNDLKVLIFNKSIRMSNSLCVCVCVCLAKNLASFRVKFLVGQRSSLTILVYGTSTPATQEQWLPPLPKFLKTKIESGVSISLFISEKKKGIIHRYHCSLGTLRERTKKSADILSNCIINFFSRRA